MAISEEVELKYFLNNIIAFILKLYTVISLYLPIKMINNNISKYVQTTLKKSSVDYYPDRTLQHYLA